MSVGSLTTLSNMIPQYKINAALRSHLHRFCMNRPTVSYAHDFAEELLVFLFGNHHDCPLEFIASKEAQWTEMPTSGGSWDSRSRKQDRAYEGLATLKRVVEDGMSIPV